MLLSACSSSTSSEPFVTWSQPEVLVTPSLFTGVHGLAIDSKGRLLAGSVFGNAIWEVDRQSGAAKMLIPAPEGQADDIAVGPNGELAWTNALMGMLRYRENHMAPMKVLAQGLPGINSLDFDHRNGKLYASQMFVSDALWEIDVTGVAQPRLIAKDLGGLNGFEVGPDGMIYGPLWFKGQVAKIDPANGGVTIISSGFGIPSAANLDDKGNLWVVDAQTGELSKVDLATGNKTVIKLFLPSLDNLAIAPEGTIYVSNMANNEIDAYDPATGSMRTLTSGKLAVPAGIKIDGNTLWVADLFAFRAVDVTTGVVSDVFRMFAPGSEIAFPFAVGVSSRLFALASWESGSVQIVERTSKQTIATISGLNEPYDAIPMEDGSVIYAELGSGTITRASGANYRTTEIIANGLDGPVQMTVGHDGAIYVTEAVAACRQHAFDTITLHAHADRSLALEHDAQHLRVWQYAQIRTPAIQRVRVALMEIRASGVPPLAVALRALVIAGAFLLRAVEVMVVRNTRGLRAFDEAAVERIEGARVDHVQRPAAAVPCVGFASTATFVAFGALEVGQYFVPGPAVAARGCPAVVVGRNAADINHAVDGRTPAQAASTRLVAAPAVQSGLWFRGEAVVVGARLRHGRCQANGDGDGGAEIVSACFQQCNASCPGVGKPTGHGAPGRPRTDDDVVEFLFHIHFCVPFCLIRKTDREGAFGGLRLASAG